jgi:hypothetical protein
MKKAVRDAIQTDKEQRLFAFYSTIRARGVCFRFACALERLLPQRFSHIPRVDDALKRELVVAPTPRKIWERYLLPAQRDNNLETDQRANIKHVARLFCRYLDATLEDRIRFIEQERQTWEEYI